MSRADMETADCIIIGAGPAGLLAATYLARFQRRAILLSEGPPRASYIPRTRNVPGYPDGLVGRDLLGRLRRQARRHGISPRQLRAESIAREGEGLLVRTASASLRGRFVLLATGVEDRLPRALEGGWEAVRKGHVRLCPICDAYDLRGEPLLVVGGGAHGAREALFLGAYGPVTLLTDGQPLEQAPALLRDALRAAGVTVSEAPIRRITGNGRQVVAEGEGGAPWVARALYAALGVRARSDLGAALGADRDPEGYLLVDRHQQTSVPGLYAAGDVVQSLSQISVAFGQAAIAASAMNRTLQDRELDRAAHCVRADAP